MRLVERQFRKTWHASTLKHFDRTQQQIPGPSVICGATKAAKNPRGLAAVADGTPA